LQQPAAGLTFEEELTIEFLGSCTALQTLVSASFYRCASPRGMQGLPRYGFPIE
jgi:hypothetical protein